MVIDIKWAVRRMAQERGVDMSLTFEAGSDASWLQFYRVPCGVFESHIRNSKMLNYGLFKSAISAMARY